MSEIERVAVVGAGDMGHGFAVPFLVATAGSVVGLALVVTQVGDPNPSDGTPTPAGD